MDIMAALINSKIETNHNVTPNNQSNSKKIIRRVLITNSCAEDQIPTSNISKQNFINSSLNGLLKTESQFTIY
jgi:hypothetical protein